MVAWTFGPVGQLSHSSRLLLTQLTIEGMGKLIINNSKSESIVYYTYYNNSPLLYHVLSDLWISTFMSVIHSLHRLWHACWVHGHCVVLTRAPGHSIIIRLLSETMHTIYIAI